MINKDNSISSKIVLSCKKEGNKTLLADSSFDIPYKLVHYGSKLLHDHLEVMMMCYSPGVMDGDHLVMDIDCAPDTEMKVFTQSFNKLHPMKLGASQTTHVSVGERALLKFLPQPMIPFRQAMFNASNEIRLGRGSHLIWGDIISGGRIQSGESFQFKKIHSQTKVYSEDKLIFYDNLLMEPKKQPVNDLLYFQGFTHQATLLLVTPFAQSFKKELDEILVTQFTDMRYGFTQCSQDAILLRALGGSGEAMYTWLGNIGEMCWSYIRHHRPALQTGKLVVMPGGNKRAPAARQDKPARVKPTAAKAVLPSKTKKRISHA